jgi:hypothetical protein
MPPHVVARGILRFLAGGASCLAEAGEMRIPRKCIGLLEAPLRGYSSKAS